MSAPRTAAAPVRPAETIRSLGSLLKSGGGAPRLVLVTNSSTARSDEPFLRDLAIAMIAADAVRRKADITKYDGAVPGFQPATLYAELTTRSLFATTSVRIIRNADAIMKGVRAEAGTAMEDEGDDDVGASESDESTAPVRRSRSVADHPFEKAALSFAKNAPAGDVAVIELKKMRAPFARAAREAGALILEFRPLYDKPFRGDGPVESTEFGEFISMLARDAGMKFAPGAMAAIVRKTGTQLGAVAAALDKLKNIGAGPELTVDIITQNVPRSRPGSPWTLASAVLAGDAARAIEEIYLLTSAGARDADGKMIASEGAFVMAMSSMIRDARRNLDAALRIRAGATLQEAASAVGVPPVPAALDAFALAVRARTPAGHRAFLDRIAEAELATRLRGEKPSSAIMRLAVRARVKS